MLSTIRKSADMEEPLITVILGIFNGEKYLTTCLESIIKQSYSNLEIVLVDDGSDDASGKIVDDYAEKDKRIKAIHQSNSGVSLSRNRAIEESKGEYICIIDQDDQISEDYVRYFYKLIIDSNAEIAYTPEVNKFFGEIHRDKTNHDHVQIITGQKAAEEMLYHKIVIAPWNKMISRRLIEKYGIKFNPDFFCGEGFAFSVECFQYAKRVAVGTRKVYNYRVGDPESGASKFRLSTIHSSLNAQQYIKNTFVEKTPELIKAWKFSNWHTHCDCLNIMVGCQVTKKYPKEYKQLKAVCQKEAFCALKAPVSLQQKLRGILFKLNPYLAAKVINHFRMRKFSKV